MYKYYTYPLPIFTERNRHLYLYFLYEYLTKKNIIHFRFNIPQLPRTQFYIFLLYQKRATITIIQSYNIGYVFFFSFINVHNISQSANLYYCYMVNFSKPPNWLIKKLDQSENRGSLHKQKINTLVGYLDIAEQPVI